MSTCVICSTEFTFFENLTNRTIKRCKKCDARFKQLQHDTFTMLEQAFLQGGVAFAMEQHIYKTFNDMRMPEDLGMPVIQRLKYLRMLTDIRAGNVPRIATAMHLDSDEYAHFEMHVTYYKPNKTLKTVPGRLIGTNKKCYFISHSGSDNATIDWNNVSQVYEQVLRVPTSSYKQNGKTYHTYADEKVLHLAVTKGSGGGGYRVPDMLYTKTMIDTLVRLWKRQLVIYQQQRTEGTIPEHIKAAVYQRDGGRCVQCGYEGPYIEYDHKYPRSKGGQNTVENVQLLCRMCNLKKGNRV
ncbi:HNH endonuclease [Dictyobacter formicarum]|uniref:HNH nuclease domain-containing protein n=1 Tax=Dictyobacter formicarum TaxID=2778368 RepID=A0ABQ3VE52_9CHLR|nr:HNH endonuclease [Dictyobacter formicarum]GHO84103.1 hypothetical protein KSZ_21090 [Dictyobacter formicarum]